MKKLVTLLLLLLCIDVVFAQTAWSPVSPNLFPTNASGQINGLTRISQLKFHSSNPSKMYAVSSRGGLFITSNAGTTWTLAPGCDVLIPMRLNSVCVDFTNDQVIYLGTGDANYYYTGSGVYKSTDGGNTFNASGLSGRLIVEMLMNPANHLMIIAATDAGIYKSIDGGATWVLKAASLACRDMVFKANAGTQTLFATTYSNLYKSTDMGETWATVTNGIYIPSGYSTGGGCRLAVSPADSNVVYFMMNAKNGSLFKSVDGGTNFVNLKDTIMPNLTGYDNTTTSVGQGDYNTMMCADPTNANILYFGAHNFWKSVNGGAAWTQMTNWYARLHTDMHWVKVNPYNTSQIWTANDGGVWVSTDGGTNWTPKCDGMYGYEIYHGACSPTRRDMFSIGTQDNGELYHSAGTWLTNRGGDWSDVCSFDYRSNSSMVYYFGRNTRRLVTGSDATYGLPVTTLQDIAFYRANSNLAFAANLDVYRTTNLQATTPSWTKISTINKTIMAVHVNLADSNSIYVITSDANIYVSTNALSANPTFTNYALPNPTSTKASITSIKSAPNVLYAVFNTKVYRSANNGATWSDVSFNLPSVNWVKILPDEYFSMGELVFVAGNNTVYYKKASQNSWTLFSNTLPVRTLINDFSVYDDGTNQSALRVSEYGRGMWEVSMTSLRAVASSFIASTTLPCLGIPVQFNDQSTGTITSWNWSFPGGTPSSSTLQNPIVTYATSGIYNVSLTVSDGTTSNTLTRTAYINTNGSGLPVSEGFESGTFPPSNFISIDDGNDGAFWQLSSSAGGFGLSPNSMYFNNFSINANGKKDEMRTARYDISLLTSASLTFDVAYQPYNTTNYSDSLEVLISTDCGATFSSIYLKGGGTLSTVAGVSTVAFTPTAAQWRTELINLNSYIASGSVIIAFRNIGRFGNNLFVDNINIAVGFTVDAGPDKNTCYGNAIAIGTPPVSGYTYFWSPTIGLSSTTISNPTAAPPVTTSYVLTATKIGTNNLIARDTMIVTVDSVPINALKSNVSCFGLTDGAITLTFNGGIAPYTYLWSNGSSSTSRTNLPPATYSVTITNGVSCSRIYSFIIAQPAAPLSATTSSTQSLCNLNNGTATAIPAGGTPPYIYSWSNGATSSINNNIVAGSYTVLVTDSRSCTTNAIAVVTAKPLPVINTFATSSSPICEGLPIVLTVNASGGTFNTTFSSGSINLAIPDNNPIGISNTIAVNSGFLLDAASKLAVTLTFGTLTGTTPPREHTWAGDVKVSLTTPGGITIVFDRPGVPASASGNSADFNGAYIFTTTAASILPQSVSSTLVVAGNIINGSYKPSDSSNPDAAHNWNGLSFPFNVNGNWTLSVSDNAGADVGDLVSWTVSFTAVYSQSFSGPGIIGAVNCLNADCSNANVTITTAPPGNNSYSIITTAPDGCTVSASANITVLPLPGQPGPIAGATQICEEDSFNYQINPVSNVTSYNWNLPSGWIIKNGQGTTVVSVDPSAVSGNVIISTTNNCGNSTPSSLAVNTGYCNFNLMVGAYVEGLYHQGGTLNPVLFDRGLHPSNLAVDSVIIELHNAMQPFALVYSGKQLIDTNGNINLIIPGMFNGGIYYIALKTRNGIETWSKNAVTLGNNTNFDFRY